MLGAMQRVKVRDKVMTLIALFRSDCGYYLHFVDINVPWILSAFCGYDPHLVDIICSGHITSYLDQNVCPIFHIQLSSVSDWFRGKTRNTPNNKNNNNK